MVRHRRPLYRNVPDVSGTLSAVPAPLLPVDARIKHFVGHWRTITEDTWVRSVVEEGYIIPFRSTPPLSTRLLPFTVTSPVQAELVKEEISGKIGHRTRHECQISRVFTVAYFWWPRKTGLGDRSWTCLP